MIYKVWHSPASAGAFIEAGRLTTLEGVNREMHSPASAGAFIEAISEAILAAAAILAFTGFGRCLHGSAVFLAEGRASDRRAFTGFGRCLHGSETQPLEAVRGALEAFTGFGRCLHGSRAARARIAELESRIHRLRPVPSLKRAHVG